MSAKTVGVDLFGYPILATPTICPNCEAKDLVASAAPHSGARLTCTACGFEMSGPDEDLLEAVCHVFHRYRLKRLAALYEAMTGQKLYFRKRTQPARPPAPAEGGAK